eukprot:TRINITY_DN1786_c0_g1_i1.p1 TRINITY_DN1786_c0_g1~~TRINITY_DN1786_c0_g1_i1.p1  ORF type:complete len:520 (-),score=104.71 TRINITY_DN1786_c0_g1_i1:116-1675(-)
MFMKSKSHTKEAASTQKNVEIEDGDIKLIKILGQGCFGTVHLGECRGSSVAVKIPLVQHLSDEELRDLRQEIQIMATNPHPHIMLFLGACTVPGKFKIVMEVLDGDLEHLLLEGEGKKLTVFQRLTMAKQAAEGMNWLHCSEPAIIHRDLKLENLMYKKTANQYEIRVADFGLACIKPKAQKSLKDTAKGTPLTRAPEIFESKPFNQKADVYSFAMCLWEVYTCKDLFPHHSDYDEFMEAVCVHGERPPIPKDCPQRLRSLLEVCWAKDPAVRPDFNEINARLIDILIESAIRDPQAQAFWKDKFVAGSSLQKSVKFPAFATALYRALGLGRVPADDSASDARDRSVLSLRALKALVAKGDPGEEVVEIQHFGNMVDWFGPFKGAASGESLLDRMLGVCALPYFHGDVETKAAERLLAKRPGVFLVRFSAAPPGAFAITRIGHDGQPKNVKIFQRDHEFTLSEKKDSKTYPTLDALVVELGGTLQLEVACSGSRFENLAGADAGSEYQVVVGDDEESEH